MMTATALITDLQTRGFGFQVDGEKLFVSPASRLTDADRAAIRQHKAELLATLATTHFCPRCGGALKLQDRQADAYFCPGCRKWCDGQGSPLPEITTPKPVTLEEVEARQLVADLLAAGCGFVTDDGAHVRVAGFSSITTALWLRLDQATPEFARLALKTAQEREAEAAPEWVM